MGFPGSSTSKESACKAGELSSAFLALEDPPAGEGKGYQVFWPEEVHGLPLEKSMGLHRIRHD